MFTERILVRGQSWLRCWCGSWNGWTELHRLQYIFSVNTWCRFKRLQLWRCFTWWWWLPQSIALLPWPSTLWLSLSYMRLHGHISQQMQEHPFRVDTTQYCWTRQTQPLCLGEVPSLPGILWVPVTSQQWCYFTQRTPQGISQGGISSSPWMPTYGDCFGS